MSRLRIVLADDHKMVREGLRMLVDAQPDMEVVGEVDDGRRAVALAKQLEPDVVVMDVSMPELNGLKATEELKTSCPAVCVLVLTRHTDDGYLQELFKVGASGYVLKESASEELVRAIRSVASGKRYVDPAVAAQLVGRAVDRSAARGVPAAREISRREEEVLRLVAWGHLSKEIADRLQISIKTVDTHKANGMAKLGMKNRIDVVRYALLKGWLRDT